MPALSSAVLISLILVAIGSFNTAKIAQGFEQGISQDFTLQTLSGKIVHIDEVLTMSARMAAATGDLAWEERYNAYEPLLTAAIGEAIALAPAAYELHAEQIDEANLKLVEMERQSFEKVRQKKPQEALKILFSEAYQAQKEVYASGMRRWSTSLERQVDANLRGYGRGLFRSSLFSMISLWVLMVAWGILLSLIHRYSQRQQFAEKRQRQSQRALEISQHELQGLQMSYHQQLNQVNQLGATLKRAKAQLIHSEAMAAFGRLLVGVSQAALGKAEARKPDELGVADLLPPLPRWQAQPAMTRLAPVNIHQLWDEVLTSLRPRLQAQPHRPAIAVTCHYGAIPDIEGDQRLLQQVFWHLLSQGIDALDLAFVGDCASVKVSPVPLAQAEFPLAEQSFAPEITLQTAAIAATDDTWIEMVLTHRGLTVVESHQLSLFEPFDLGPLYPVLPLGSAADVAFESGLKEDEPKVSAAKVSAPKGGAKGGASGAIALHNGSLAASHLIVSEIHGGQLTYEATPGDETRFILQLPVKQTRREGRPDAPAASAATFPSQQEPRPAGEVDLSPQALTPPRAQGASSQAEAAKV